MKNFLLGVIIAFCISIVIDHIKPADCWWKAWIIAFCASAPFMIVIDLLEKILQRL